jgi:hypothetical protein
MSTPVGFIWEGPMDEAAETLLWKQLHTYHLSISEDPNCSLSSIQVQPESREVLLQDGYFASDEARQREPLQLCDSIEGDVPAFPGAEDWEAYAWQDTFPGPPPHPDNFDILNNATKQLYLACYYRPDGTFMTVAE